MAATATKKKSSGKTGAKKTSSRPTPPGVYMLDSSGVPRIHMMVFGDPGSQKTRLAGTSMKPLIINCDGASGLESLRSIHNPSVMVRDAECIDDVYEMIEYIKGRRHDRQWLWLDSLTLLQELEMDLVMATLVRNKPHRDPDVPDQAEYLKVQNRLKKLVRDLIKLDINVGITAHVLRVEDQDDDTVQYWPAITGKLMPQKIAGYMGIVGHMGIIKKKEDGKNKKGKQIEVVRLRVQRTDKIYAKDRYGALGAGMDSPTIPRIEKAVKKAVEAA